MAELDEYRAKRRFTKTPEPQGDRKRARAKAPRFVVQEHHATRLHWDLRLEHEGALASWAVPNGIPDDPEHNRKAVRTEDHPLEYLGFEGTIPEGNYGAGEMTIWDRGTFEIEKWEPGKVVVVFDGERLQGRYSLFRAGRAEKDWMIHRMDPPADPTAQEMPDLLAPMLAKPGKLPADEERWAFEVKWDGVRAVAHSQPGRLKLVSRNGNDVTGGYPELRALNRALGSHAAILDGEIVCFDDQGRPSFEALQGRMHLRGEAAVRRRAAERPVTYVIFDLLWLDGHPLAGLSYEERRARLSQLELDGAHWRVPEHHVGEGAALLEVTREHGIEGVIAKRLDSRYEPGRRSSCWLKIKNVNRQEVVIGGWTTGTGKRAQRIGALHVGVHGDEGELVYAGRVGTGFSGAELERLERLFEPLQRKDSPFTGRQPARGAHFVDPQLVCEVEFTEWTRQGMLRHPSYKGLRDDKAATAVVREGPDGAAGAAVGDSDGAEREIDRLLASGRKVRGGVEVEIEGRRLKLSNPDKVMYPATGFAKGDVVEYYLRIAPVLLPHLRDRPLTLKRYPDGVEGQHFYEKRCPSHAPDWVQTAAVPSGRKGTIEFCLAQDVPTLAWAANLADLELHPSLARAPEVDRPTVLAFDLDPGPPADIVECCDVGLLLRDMFASLGLECFPKTSGSKGLQIYIPLNTPKVTFDDTKPFSHAVAELLEREHPKLIVSRQAKDLRGGKVLVDWSQNDRHKTTVSVYSLRARERPTVSTPVTWDEVETCAKARDADLLVFDSAAVLERVEEHGDLFEAVNTLQQDLPDLGR